MPATIRFATPHDAPAIADIYAPFCTASTVSFEEVAPSVEEMAARITKISARYPYLVLDVDGTLAGYAYGTTHRERAAYRWTVEVTVYIHPQFHRRGVGRALYTTLLSFLTQQGFHLAVGGVTLPNPGSVGLHEAMGFVQLGVYREIGYKYGEWRDVAWFQRPLTQGVPVEPRSVEEVVESPGWPEAVAAGLAHFRAI